MSVRIYTQEEEHADELNNFLEAIEDIVEINQNITYDDNGNQIFESKVQGITTDQGVMAPLGVGEINFILRYPIPSVVCCGPSEVYPCP
jgi:hypothetical protein